MERQRNYNQNQNQNQNQQRYNHNSNSSSSSSSSNYRGLPHDRSLWINRNDPDRNSIGADLENSLRNRMLNSVAIPENLTSRRDLLNPERNRSLCAEVQEIIAARSHPVDRNRMRNVQNREYLIEQRDHVSEWAMTIGGCEYLQSLLAAADGGLRETILAIVAADLPILMVHDIGFLFVRALFLSCDEHQMNRVLQSFFVGNDAFLDICNNYYGSETIKALIQNLEIETNLTIVTNVLEAYISYFTNYIHPQNVLRFFIYTCNHNFSRMRLFNAMANNCLAIATNRLGSKVLQCSICPMFINSGLISSLLDVILVNVLVLANDVYGNYLIQHVIDANIEGVTKWIVEEVMGRFCDFAQSQFGSNVVKKCLEKCEQRELVMIVVEFTYSSQLCSIAKNYFGHYVLLCALEHIYYRGTIQHFHSLVRRIHGDISSLQAHWFGKKVIEKIIELSRKAPFQPPQ